MIRLRRRPRPAVGDLRPGDHAALRRRSAIVRVEDVRASGWGETHVCLDLTYFTPDGRLVGVDGLHLPVRRRVHHYLPGSRT